MDKAITLSETDKGTLLMGFFFFFLLELSSRDIKILIK